MRDCFDWNFNCAAIIWHEPTPQVARPNNFSYRAGNAAAPALMPGSCRPLRKAAAPQYLHSSGETIGNTLPSKRLHCLDTCSRPLNNCQNRGVIRRGQRLRRSDIGGRHRGSVAVAFSISSVMVRSLIGTTLRLCAVIWPVAARHQCRRVI